MSASRLKGKPLLEINNLPIICHVVKKAQQADIGEVIVATEDEEILNTVKKNGGKAILTSSEHQTGTDRIYEVFKDHLNSEPNTIVNLQGDMPNIDPRSITELISYMDKKNCDIGTLASSFASKTELLDENNVKVAVKNELPNNQYEQAIDFFRIDTKKHKNFYHHVGIYAFTSEALVRYVGLKRSRLEIERKLEQMRALENSMTIHVGYINSSPLSVDTKVDLMEVRKIMKKDEKIRGKG